MRPQTFGKSTCRFCRHYKPEGRRGGTCQQLGVPVRGCWKTCSIGTPALGGDRAFLGEDIVRLENSLALDYITSSATLDLCGAAEVTP
ncbi:MAG: hypothetical protein SW833_01550 [Cyanobacteriota bacterium]|nr:hypothetical protein [Cyanobacteriota bacterium]